MNKELIIQYFILLFVLCTSCLNSQDTKEPNTPTNLPNSSVENITTKPDSIPASNAENNFISQLNEKWNSSLSETEVHNEFMPNFEELRKGNMVLEWKHTIEASKLKNYAPKKVQIINFGREDIKLLGQFLLNTDSFLNIEAISIGGINLEGELIGDLIDQLSNKKHFKKLILSVSYLKKLPSSINQLEFLETLDLSNNELTTLPKEIGDLKKLKHLNLRNNRSFRQFPTELGNLSNLEYLGFEGSKLVEIPNSISGCENLLKIVGNACKIKAIPSSIGQCVKLLRINLAANSIDSVPSEMGNLSQLKFLSLGSNNISIVPKSFENLDNITFCNFDDNKIETFPMALLGLSKVQNLWLHENSFSRVPIALAKMKSLTHFLVDESEISKDDIKNIKELNSSIRIIEQD